MATQEPVRAAKAALRRQILRSRASRPAQQRARTADTLRDTVLTCPEVAAARLVAAYLSVGGEPGTVPLLDSLRARGTRVLLPVLRPDLDLDWAEYSGPGCLVPGPRGTWEPCGPRRGIGAVSHADAVVVPALAVDGTGNRLGRGGGSYDRALTRVPAGVAVIALVHEDEVVDAVPAEAHDRPVTAFATPTLLHRIPVHH